MGVVNGNFYFFFFNDTATTKIYTLSLHDALPISGTPQSGRRQQDTPPGPHPLETAATESPAKAATRSQCAAVSSTSRSAVKRHPSIAQPQPASGQPDSALAGSRRR